MRYPRFASVCGALLAACIGAPGWALQPGTQKPAIETPAADKAPGVVPLSSLPPQIRLGARVNLIQRQVGVIPVLVVVEDDESFLDAVGRWTLREGSAARFPVLIDDGSLASQLLIARFVRAFGPETILRHRASKDAPRLPVPGAARQEAMATAAARSWGASSSAELIEVWAKVGFSPPGVVVAWDEDPAWPAAVALAAARGQPIVWRPGPGGGGPSDATTLGDADALSKAVTDRLDALKLAHAGLGEGIDAITLCLNAPVKVSLPEGDKRGQLALTDVIGREPAEPRGRRWAWAGQIIGDRARSAYAAMSALFLMPDKAWLFDGYDSTQPWVQWDQTAAGKVLSEAGVAATVIDAPGGAGIDSWRTAGAMPGVDAGIVAVTTKGNAEFFDLAFGQGRSVDVPILRRPAIAYFVHSWSARAPTERYTIGGMWLERGVYAYVGSVNEPYLNAFVPTPGFMQRMVTGVPIGAAVRIDNAPAWKIAMLGDPLITLGPAGRRLKQRPPLEGAGELADGLPALLKAKEFPAALRLLSMLGRDADAARLVLALSKDNQHPLSVASGIAGLPSAFAAGDRGALLAAGLAAAPALADTKKSQELGLGVLKDMLWMGLGAGQAEASAELADVLAAAVRPEVMARDMREAMGLVRRARGEAAARAMLDRALLDVKDRATADELEKLRR